MPKIYSVDQAIRKNQPYVELRGRYYKVRDLTVRERIEKILEYRERQKKAEKEAEEKGDEATFEDLREVISDAVQEALVDVPDEVAESITESEWQLIQQTIQKIQEDTFPVEVREEEEIDEGKVGPRTG